MSKVTKYFRGKVRSINPEKHTAEVVISDETIDRYQERVLVSSFKSTLKDFMKHPIMLSSHSYRGLLSQIGEYENIRIDEDNKEVIATPKWYAGEGNPEADWGWKLAEKGIAAFSIGFIPNKIKEYPPDERKKGDPNREYEDIELLETSQVLIPANPSALQRDYTGEDPFLRDLAAEIALVMKEESVVDTTTVTEEIIEDKGWEETDTEIRHRLKDPNLFEKFRYITLKKIKPRVNGIYGKFKDKNEWALQALRFPKSDGWTMEEAKKWLEKNPSLQKDVETPDPIEMLLDLTEQITSLSAMVVDIRAYTLRAVEEMEKEPVIKLAEEATKTVITAIDANVFAEQLKNHAELISQMLVKAPMEDKPPVVSDDVVVDTEEEVEGILSEEKLLEVEEALRRSMSPSAVEEFDIASVKVLLDQMTEEVSRVFSSQPKGNGRE